MVIGEKAIEFPQNLLIRVPKEDIGRRVLETGKDGLPE
jgi:hypothetical protein